MCKLKNQKSKIKNKNATHSKPPFHSVMHNQLALRVVSGDHIKGATPSKEKDRFPGLFPQRG